MDRSTWVEIDVSALKHNFSLVSEHAVVPICAVVKANGYGHGLVIAARAFAREAGKLDCEISVGSPDQVASVPPGARAHLIVDTGMGRLGVRPADFVEAARS